MRPRYREHRRLAFSSSCLQHNLLFKTYI
ncbi:hypothetical protein CKAH01_02029 [Colletotrichum kahawae]|uniref:Uncharacterized protein n=1 Tax=Colletotrichum kahawae TaxID=34407 RepID=A0AAD9Y0C4_COLKA|nr:hypothetical protein CKAH01_02029 [Colletotrichum kahawae]